MNQRLPDVRLSPEGVKEYLCDQFDVEPADIAKTAGLNGHQRLVRSLMIWAMQDLFPWLSRRDVARVIRPQGAVSHNVVNESIDRMSILLKRGDAHAVFCRDLVELIREEMKCRGQGKTV